MAKLLIVALLALAVSVSAFEKMSYREFMSRREPNPAKEAPVPANIELLTIEQHIDNFNPQNHATFQQRYYTNSEFYRPGGPLYVFLSGEWRITPYRLSESLMADMAADMYGHISYLEHRYYGESHPFEEVTDENLRFLTQDQALADVAHFIQHLKETVEGAEDSPVIIIGGHYSGSLAVWFRQKYPHLALAAWASSAPLLSIIDHFQYKELAGATYRYIGGPECYDALEDGFEQMEAMVAAQQFEELRDMFNLCEVVSDPNDVSTFFAAIAEFYAIITQFATVQEVNYVCNLIQDETAPTPAERIALILTTLVNDECIPVDYEAIIEYDRQTSQNDSSVIYGVRQATYQTCTQLGWHHSSLSEQQPFGSQFPIEFFHEACEDVFTTVFSNETAHDNSDRLNVIHGGLRPEVTNVIFTQGSLDPWRSLGVQEDLNDDAPAFVINDASQGNDLGPLSEDDSQELQDVKLRIKYLIRYWIARESGIIVVPT